MHFRQNLCGRANTAAYTGRLCVFSKVLSVCDLNPHCMINIKLGFCECDVVAMTYYDNFSDKMRRFIHSDTNSYLTLSQNVKVV